MSENKYIIDKDSLTGIADAVRNKLLGAGEATTDPQTGDIVYPEDKGYYLKKEVVAKISGFGWSETNYRANFAQNYAPYISAEDWNAAVGEPWYSVEITLVNVSGRSYDMNVYYTGASQGFANVTSSTYTVSAPNGSTYFKLYFSNDYNPSIYDGRSSLGSLVAVFKDAEGKPIKPKQSSCHYLFTLSKIQGTANFETVDVPTKIPFSIDDIQDRITNYLERKTTPAIDYEGLSYGYIAQGGSSFYSDSNKKCFLTFIPLNAGQKIGFCIGETVSNRLRAGFFSGKTYNNFSQYVENSFSNSQIYSGGISITGSAELSGDGLLKRFYYTAPSDGMLVVSTSYESKLAFLHVWEATE